MQKIIPHLWFDKDAKEAASFYIATFKGNSKIKKVGAIHDTPAGDCVTVSFDIRGYSFNAISTDPATSADFYAKINPSISFMLNFDPSQDARAREDLDARWEALSEGATVRMPLDSYPFSPRYGWIEDKYGVSWQLILSDPEGDPRPFVVPSIMFTGAVCGKAKEAMDFYLSVFTHTKKGYFALYGKGQEPDKEGDVMYADFMLAHQWISVADSAYDHKFAYNDALSLMCYCETQKEIDYYWEALSAVPEAEQCGWLKDKYGVSWQITPVILDEMLAKGSRTQVDRVMQAFLPMKKFDIAALEKAYKG